MNYDDILGSIKELLQLYQRGEDGRNSDRAQELRALLAKAFPADVERATKFFARNNVRQHPVITGIQNDINTARQTEDISAPKSDNNGASISEDNTARQTEETSAPKSDNDAASNSEDNATHQEVKKVSSPTKPKKNKSKKDDSALGKGQQAVLATLAEYASEEGIDLTTVTRDNYRDIVSRLETAQEKAIAADLHVYLTDKTDDYSDRIADYLSADDLSPSKQRYHWTKTLSILRSEFTARPQSAEERVNRDKVMELALNVYQSSKIRSDKNPKVPEPRVAELTEALLTKMSKVAQSDYQKRLQKNKHRIFPRDKFLADIKSNTRNDQDLIPLTDKIAAAHVQKMLESLEPAAQDKYIASLRKNDLAEYIPEGYVPHKKEHETKQNNGDNPHKEGDKTMADTDIQDTQNKRDESYEIKDIYQNLVYIYSDYLHDRSMSEEQMLSKMNQVFDKLSDEERQDLDKFIRNEIVPQAEERNGTPGFIDGGNPLSWCFKIRGYLTQYERIHDESMQENPHKQGDKTMTEENKNTEDTAQPVEQPTADTAQPVEQPTGDTAQPIEQPTEENFKPSAIQQKACGLAGLNWEDYKDAASLMAAVEDKGFKIDGANILKMDGENSSVVATVNEDEQNNNPQPETEEKKEEKKEEEKEEEKKEETKEPITFTPLEENNTPVQTQENDDWIARKAAYYKGLSDENKIENYERDETVQDGFAASFNGAKIHYSSPNDVAVSKEAGLDVFDAMLKEPDNKGRRVNFSPDMTPEMAARLYAACLINGNEMGGNAPQLTEEQLKAALGDEYAVFQQKMAERATEPQAAQQTTEQQTTEQPNREGAETTNTEATSAESTEVKEPTKEEIKQALRDQYDMAQMEMAGKVSKLERVVPGTSPYVKGNNCSDEEFDKYLAMQERAQTGKSMLYAQYQKDPEAFRAIMNEVVQEAQISKINALRTRAHLNTRQETKDEKTARRNANIKAVQAALGIIDGYTDSNGVEHKKLEGDALKKYIDDQKITAYTYGNLGGQDEEFAKKLPPVREGGNAKADFDKGKATRAEVLTKQNNGNQSR